MVAARSRSDKRYHDAGHRAGGSAECLARIHTCSSAETAPFVRPAGNSSCEHSCFKDIDGGTSLEGGNVQLIGRTHRTRVDYGWIQWYRTRTRQNSSASGP